MNKKISRIIGLVMVVIAIVFVVFALNHPEMSFPWNNTITWVLYGLYAIVAHEKYFYHLSKPLEITDFP